MNSSLPPAFTAETSLRLRLAPGALRTDKCGVSVFCIESCRPHSEISHVARNRRSQCESTALAFTIRREPGEGLRMGPTLAPDLSESH
ncbi:hypothetical protein FA95DRAFT_1005521 [Auriscalpium vulgare]|uniref:Uncharacterized protein n=1 Tax=Auriscalpium vulgare TaxID=40419 RepID=A0ACB8RYM7_9AGAM|nr:hypothetical protein FA95DRAFT_1005521 [Auriscalpium vulgare]